MPDTRSAPYAADIRAKGWRFELDHERIRQSDTWALASSDVRPWLLMLWMTAWEQAPCGSLPDSDELICARIGMSVKAFTKAKAILMRGWWLADDGRLYHDTIVARVLEMLEYRRKNAQRVATHAAKKKQSPGTNALATGEPQGSNDTGTSTGTSNSVAIATGGDAAKSPAEMTKDELWSAGKSLLRGAGLPDKQCGSFVGKLVKDYGDAVVIDAVRAAVVARPADPLEYLKATCMRSIGQRQPVNKQEALEAANQSVVQRLLEKENAHAA